MSTGGVLYPDWKVIDYSLHPKKSMSAKSKAKDQKKELHVYGEREVNSKVAKQKVKIWDQSYKDLERNTKVLINNSFAVHTDHELKPTPNEYFDKVLNAVDNNIEAAKNIINLSSQAISGDILLLLQKAKGIRVENPQTSLITLDMMLSFKKDDKGNFLLEKEVLIKTGPTIYTEDDEGFESKFLKQKIIISGKVEDLGKSRSKKLKSKVVYTKEYDTLQEAKKADYEVIESKIDKTEAGSLFKKV